MEKLRRWEVIHRNIPTQSIGAEVGVFKGKTSRYLLENMPMLTLYMVDRWQPYQPHEQEEPPPRMSNVTKKQWANIEKKVRKIQRKYKDRAFIIKDDSTLAACRFVDASLDFVFIDANHKYEYVKRDIEAWLPKVKPCGLLMGHDITRADVEKAVNETGMPVSYDHDKVWIIRKAYEAL